MNSAATFKICIAVSAFFHMALFYAWPLFHPAVNHETRFKKIELTYLRERPLKNAVIKKISTAAQKKVDGRSERIKKKNVSEVKAKRKIEDKVPLIPEAYSEAKITVGQGPDDTKRGALLETYRLKVRELIDASLRKYADSYNREGEVRIKFVISRGGNLADIMVEKSPHRGIRSLEIIAIKGVKEAAPFPPFDEEIRDPEIVLNIPIQFSLPEAPFSP